MVSLSARDLPLTKLAWSRRANKSLNRTRVSSPFIDNLSVPALNARRLIAPFDGYRCDYCMETQRTELLNQLPKHGWNVVSIEEDSLEWWADEMWVLESVWSPVGSRAYVTLLVDPQAPVNRKKGTYVWAAKVSFSKPNRW